MRNKLMTAVLMMGLVLLPMGEVMAQTPGKAADAQAESKKRLEEELNNTNVSGKTLLNFPNRPSLGSLELAPLPGINDSGNLNMTPMAPSVSGKDLPSEQLLGRLTPEVFQEMADLERGNTFLKLQVEKEKLKNDLENLRATYRQHRLDEIAKRENVVRTRIQWWQEQERVRLEAERKRAEEELLAKKVQEQEAVRDQIREEARQRLMGDDKGEVETPVVEVVEVTPPSIIRTSLEDYYTLESIRGVGSNLKARLQDKNDGSVLVVKKDDILPSGHVVKEITKSGMTAAFGKQIDQLIFRPVMQ